MADNHAAQIPIAIESLVQRLADIELVLGNGAAPVLAIVRARLIESMAARDRGDIPAAVEQIGGAMDQVAVLADQLDPAEAVLMRALAQSVRTALRRG